MKYLILFLLLPLFSHSQSCEGPVLEIVKPVSASYDQVTGLKVEGYIENIMQIIQDHEVALKKECPSCRFNSHLEFVFNAIPREEIICGADYIDVVHSYQREFQVEAQNECDEKDKDRAFAKVRNFVGTMTVGTFWKKHEDDEVNQMSDALWAQCPKGCSFSVDQNTSFDEKSCTANLDLNIKCGNKAQEAFGIGTNNKFQANMRYQKFRCFDI